VLWEGHSIRSVVPFLFDGRLPDINLGTSSGASCSPELQQRLASVLERQSDYSFIVNGRFKGGYITRHYGRPAEGVQAVQLDLAQLNYMDEDSFVYVDAGGEPSVIRRCWTLPSFEASRLESLLEHPAKAGSSLG
jgi:N-formylglutamate deformylase